MLWRAKDRARAKGIAFDLTEDDIDIPEFCPVLGLRLEIGGGDSSPSLDRIDNAQGYIPSNVVVVSHLANRLKNSATLEQLQAVTLWLAKAIEKNIQ